MWMEQELQKIYLMSAKIRSCSFSRSSVAQIFETYTKKKKKMTVGRNYVSLSSPSPCWLYFKRLTVVRLILCNKWGVKGGGVLCTRGNARLLIITGYPPSHREGWYTFARACVRVLKYSISCQWRKRTRIKIDLHMKYQPLRKFRKGSWSSH